MNFPDLSPTNKEEQWKRFSELLWFSEDLGFWLDISNMQITASEFKALEKPFQKAFDSMNQLERGTLANKDENRMVGHYWLRTPTLAPNEEISNSINNQINLIEAFGQSLLKGSIKTDQGKLFTDVLWIGIGGSGLGPMLITNSLQENYKGLNFHFLDNVDPAGIIKKFEKIGDHLSSTLFVIVSKSGGTPEPKICMDQARQLLTSKGYEWQSRAVAITMPNSKLDKLAEQENWLKRFELPDWVGGRTSITSAVGLLPLVLINSDYKSFLLGASIMDKYTRVTEIYKNPAALLAASWFSVGQGKGLRDMVVLPYRDSLDVISKYLQQLIMESLGKKNNRSGDLVNQGLSVYGNKGSTDQHAYVQQLRDGINNFFVTFIEVLKSENDLPALDNMKPGDYLSGFLQGTRLALTENLRQNITITIKEFNPFSLGALIALFERTVGLYAELIDINAYDQPGVEAGKKAAAEILDVQKKILDILSNGNRYHINDIILNFPDISKDSIFMIIRNISFNSSEYLIEGNWNEPSSLFITKLKGKVI